ncbi:MAG TPA: hypothetical protein VMV81_02185 [Phycisphaerae bacterium]|nr:hypothetical protein [Phycisphaerae bacterium]
MSLKDIETAIENLSPNDFAAFRHWFAEYDSRQWDEQIERDAAEGRLDSLAEEALKDFREGRCTEL